MRYDAVRSNTDKSLHIICRENAFESRPHCVRHLSGGAIETLKPRYRLMLAEQGFVIVYQKLAAFSADLP
jgi:hypothetical protein